MDTCFFVEAVEGLTALITKEQEPDAVSRAATAGSGDFAKQNTTPNPLHCR